MDASVPVLLDVFTQGLLKKLQDYTEEKRKNTVEEGESLHKKLDTDHWALVKIK